MEETIFKFIQDHPDGVFRHQIQEHCDATAHQVRTALLSLIDADKVDFTLEMAEQTFFIKEPK